MTNPIVRVTAPIDIVKFFTDNGYTGVVDPATIYNGTWVCTYVGAGPTTTVEGEWSATGSSSGTLAVTTGGADSILVGSVCGVTEVTPPPPSAADPSYRWGTPGLQGVTVAPVPGTNRMQVSNSLERDTGDLRVAKEITGDTDGYVGGDDPSFTGFPVSAICYLNSPDDDVVVQGIVDVKPGEESPLLTGVPAGWTCDVAETGVAGQLFDASYRWGDAVIRIDGASGTQTEIATGETALVEVENPIERVTGGLDIVKALDTSIPAGVVVDAAFQGAYECEYEPGTAREELFSGNWSVDALSAGSTSAVLDGDEEFPLGTSCSLTEEPPAGGLKDDSWTWGDPVIPAPVLVTETPTASLTVTNTATRVWAGLSVTKAYAGLDGAIADPDLEVTGSWSCTYDGAPVGGGSGTWTLPATGGSTTVAAPGDGILPATSVCTVTEATLDDADLVDGSYRWDAAQFAPAGGIVTLPAGGVGAVTVTNSTVRVTGAFQVTKALDLGPDVLEARIDPALEFGGHDSCQYGTDAPGTGVWGPIHVDEVWQHPRPFGRLGLHRHRDRSPCRTRSRRSFARMGRRDRRHRDGRSPGRRPGPCDRDEPGRTRRRHDPYHQGVRGRHPGGCHPARHHLQRHLHMRFRTWPAELAGRVVGDRRGRCDADPDRHRPDRRLPAGHDLRGFRGPAGPRRSARPVLGMGRADRRS